MNPLSPHDGYQQDTADPPPSMQDVAQRLGYQGTAVLRNQGHYPSKRQVGELLPCLEVFQESEVRVVWHEILRDLGWSQ